MQDIGVAVVGAGFIGPVHVEGLRRAGLNVVGILGVSDDESRGAAASLGIPKAYRSFDEMLSDPAVQSVHLATPNRLHYDQARRALQAGKHVLCEKPLAMNSRESADLVALARQTRRAAGVNYNLRYYPLCLEAREMVRSGRLGKVYSVCGSYVQDWLLYPTDYNWRVLAEEGGELRAVADIGTHWLDLVHAIT
ncbi:MAG: Gfo/Idh/MocA family oxidoreductase, partial [Thermoguttaceae bacterium]|nr:Gfo/Idh/MocA family oxidoreductase [Thermoguttaceae bacterium]